MPALLRYLSVTAAAGAAITLAAATPAATAAAGRAAATAAPAAPPASAHVTASARPAARPGRTASPITLGSKLQLNRGSYDAATDASGRTYIGWISSPASDPSGRKVHLCTLPRGITRCSGRIQTIDSLGGSSAVDLHVLATAGGKVTLVWFHDTIPGSENGPNGSQIATATSQSGGKLSTAQDVASAPSFGSMLDATLGRGGSIWTVSEPADGDNLQIRPGLTNSAVTIKAPYVSGGGQLRLAGSTAVLAIQEAGKITQPVSFASEKNGHWSKFRKVARTWTSNANLGLAGTRSGIRLIASVDNADYWPVVSRWTGGGFSRRALTGDRNNCHPSTHDPVGDASGRMADVSLECQDVAITNLTDTRHAAIVRFAVRQTFAGSNPQITTTPRGRGWVVWSVQLSGPQGDKLMAAPVLLPGRVVAASRSAGGNRVTVHGPASCLPPVSVAAGVTGRPAAGWHVVSRALRLGRKALHGETLNGASLKAGKSYALHGRVTFADGGSRRSVTATLRFRSCPNS